MIKFNYILYAFILSVALFFLNSCERNERLANVMSAGSGIWLIEKVHYTNYDTTGNVTLDSVVNNMGELVFFDSSTLGELFNYNACVYIQYDSIGKPIASYPCEYFTDKYRFDIRYGPGIISRTYTVEDWGTNKQTWSYTTTQNINPNASNLATEIKIFIKRK